MFAVPLLFLTVNPDFFLPNWEFDQKYCEAEVDAMYAATSFGAGLSELKKARRDQRQRMLSGLPPVPSRRPSNTVRPTPTQANPMFAVAMMFLTVHPDFYLPNEKFDPKYCQPEYGRLLGTWDSYRREVDTYMHAITDQERDAAIMGLEDKCYRIVKGLSELNDLRFYQRGRFLRGVPLHLYIER